MVVFTIAMEEVEAILAIQIKFLGHDHIEMFFSSSLTFV